MLILIFEIESIFNLSLFRRFIDIDTHSKLHLRLFLLHPKIKKDDALLAILIASFIFTKFLFVFSRNKNKNNSKNIYLRSEIFTI